MVPKVIILIHNLKLEILHLIMNENVSFGETSRQIVAISRIIL